MTIGLRFDKGVSAGTADQAREDFAVGDVCTIVATGVVGTATFQILAAPPGSSATLVVVDPVTQTITIDVSGRWRIRVGDTADGSRVQHTFAAPTVIRSLIAPAHNERASEDANAADVDPGTWVDEGESNLGGRNTGYAPDLQKVVAAVDGSAELETGWLIGGDITVNVDTTKYDVAEGYVFVQGTGAVKFGPFLAVDPPNLVLEDFTLPAIDASGALIQQNVNYTATQRRTLARLQTVQHIGTTIQGTDTTRFLAEHVASALADYVLVNGPLNTGNSYSAAASDLTVKKDPGVTTLYMLNGQASVTAPNDQTNAAQNPVAFPTFPFFQSIRDGAGDFLLSPLTAVPVGFWDNNTGALLATPKFVIYRFQFFNNGTILIVGQDTYDTLTEGIAAIFNEDPKLPSAFEQVRNTFRTALVAKGDVTNLSSGVDMKFVNVSPNFAGGMVETF